MGRCLIGFQIVPIGADPQWIAGMCDWSSILKVFCKLRKELIPGGANR